VTGPLAGLRGRCWSLSGSIVRSLPDLPGVVMQNLFRFTRAPIRGTHKGKGGGAATGEVVMGAGSEGHVGGVLYRKSA